MRQPRFHRAAALVGALLLSACATATFDEPDARIAVGTDEGVRVEATITGDTFGPGARVPISYEVTNRRERPIAVADIVAETTYDAETREVTVGVGSEVPGEQMLPRLVVIAPGKSQTFATAALIRFPGGTNSPNALRLRLNFLSDVEPFAELVGITQKAVLDPKRATELFPLWVERTEAVFTNAVPMRWGVAEPEPISARRP